MVQKCLELHVKRKICITNNHCMTHPHNFYVQLLAETGIIGFLFYFSAFCYVIYSALRQLKFIIFKQKRHLSDYQVCLLAGILISVWPFSPNGNFFNNWLMITYSFPLVFIFNQFILKIKKIFIKKYQFKTIKTINMKKNYKLL